MMANFLSLLQTAHQAITSTNIPAELSLLADLAVGNTAILPLAWITCTLMRRRSAATRNLVWTAAIIAVLAAPFTLLITPKFRIPAPWMSVSLPAVTAAASKAIPPPPPAETPLPERATTLRIDLSTMDVAEIDDDHASVPVEPVERPAAKPEKISLPWSSIVLAVWMLGAFMFLARILFGHVRLRAMAGAAAGVDADDYPCDLHEFRHVQFRQSNGNTMPMTWGWTRPVVLLPANFKQWDKERQAMTLHHELAHVKRADWLTQTLAQVARAIYWFHPMVWLAHDRMRIEADRACDDTVLNAGVKASGYAGHLVRVAREFRTAGLRPWVAIAMAHPSSLDQRVQYVLDGRIERSAPGARARCAIALGVAAIVFAFSSVEAVGQAPIQVAGPGAAPVVALTAAPEQESPILALPVKDAEPALESDASAEIERLQQEVQLLAQAQTKDAEKLSEEQRKNAKATMDRKMKEAGEKLKSMKRGPEQAPPLSPESQRTVAAALRKALTSPDAEIRSEAAEALGRLRSPDDATVQALSKALADSEPEVQKNAVSSLSHLLRNTKMEPPQVVALFAPAVNASDAGVRKEAAEALGRVRGPAAVEVLTKMTSDRDPEVQQEALVSLGRALRHLDAAAARAALPALQAALQHQNPEVRREIVETLGGLRQIADEVVPLLAKAAEDPDPSVQREAVEALGRISSPGRHFEWDGGEWEGLTDKIHDKIGETIEGTIQGTIEGTIEGIFDGKEIPSDNDLLKDPDQYIRNQHQKMLEFDEQQREIFRDQYLKGLKREQATAKALRERLQEQVAK